jgi:ParB-like chromosome segregation protein Spo0J
MRKSKSSAAKTPAGGEAMVIRDEKPTSWFKESRNIRDRMDEGSLRELGASMLTYGQIQDVVAEADGTLIVGHRRLAAAKLVGIAALTVKIVEG